MKNKLFLSLFALATIISAHAQKATPFACYDLNGNAVDAVHGYNGILHLTKDTTDRFGKLHSAAYFNGITNKNGVSDTSYIILPDVLKKQLFSVSLWVKPASISPDSYILFAKNSLQSNFEGFCIAITNQAMQTSKNNANGINRTSSTAMLTVNQWAHVAAVVSYDSLKLYVNGMLMKSLGTFCNIDYQTGKPLLMGSARESSFDAPYTGAIDDLEFFDSDLSNAQIFNLFNNGSSCVTKGTSTVNNLNNNIRIFSIFPNPANNILTLKYDISKTNGNILEVQVIDLLGKLVLQKPLQNSSGEEKFDISVIQKGLYFVRLKANDNVIETIKFIKN